MSKIALTPNASGSGTFTIASPNSDTDRTLVLPDSAGTIATTNGITMVDQWRITATTNTSTTGVISTNIEQVDEAMFTTIGSSMTQSSGVFTFPETGIYLVTVTANFNVQSDSACGVDIEGTQDNSSYETIQRVTVGGGSDLVTITATGSSVIDITNTSTHKVRFSTVSFGTGEELLGDTNANRTFFTFMRLGDT